MGEEGARVGRPDLLRSLAPFAGLVDHERDVRPAAQVGREVVLVGQRRLLGPGRRATQPLRGARRDELVLGHRAQERAVPHHRDDTAQPAGPVEVRVDEDGGW